MRGRPKTRKNAPKLPTDTVLHKLANLENLPAAQRKSFFESVRANLRTTYEEKRRVNKKGTTLYAARPTLHDKLDNLNEREQVPQTSLVPDDVLRKVADLGRVSANQHRFYFSGIRYYVREAYKLSGLVKRGLEKEKGTALLRAARALYEVLGTLNTDERRFLERLLGDELDFNVFSKISGRRLGELKFTTYQLVLLFSLVTGAPHPEYPYEGPHPRRRGKTRGTVKDLIFQNFVCALLILTSRALGRFTLEKNIRTGTLIDAVKILAPFLPDGIVPKRLPTSTLQRLKTWCEQIIIDQDDLEYGRMICGCIHYIRAVPSDRSERGPDQN